MRRWFAGPREFAPSGWRPPIATKMQAARPATHLPPVVVLGVILALSGAAGFGAQIWDDKRTQAELNSLGATHHMLLQHGLTGVEQMILTVARQFEVSDKAMRRLEFGSFIDRLSGAFDGALEIDWAPRVRRGDRAENERAAAHQGLVGYRINTLGPETATIPAEEQDDYFPVFYVHGGLKTPPRLGFDIRSDPAQRAAIERLLEGSPLAATLPLEQPPSDVFLLAPVFAFDRAHDTPQDRRRNLKGVIRGAIMPGALIDQIFRADKSSQGVDIEFFRSGAGPDELPFYIHSSQRSGPAAPRPRAGLEASLHWTGDVTLADTRWTMIVTRLPGGFPLGDYARAWTAATLALLLTLAALGYVWSCRRNAVRLQGLVTGLSEREQKFRRLCQNAPEAICMTDAEGTVDYWNPASERMFGYKAAEILGRGMHEVLAAERCRAKPVAAFARFIGAEEGGLLGLAVEFDALRKDGSEFPIELTISEFHLQKGWSVIAVARDMTIRKRIAAALEYQGLLIHAVSSCAAELSITTRIEDAIPKVLETIGKAAHADRVVLVETRRLAADVPVPVFRYSWHSADAPVLLDIGSFPAAALEEFEMDPWFAPLRDGNAVAGLPRVMRAGAAKVMFDHFAVESVVDVPVIVDGTYLGRLGFDDCKGEREWTTVEIDIVQTVADLIGGALGRVELDLIPEQPPAGLAAAVPHGQRGGRKMVMTDEKLRRARTLIDEGLTVREAAVKVKVGKTALYTALKTELGNGAAVSKLSFD